jgi:UDP-GlcNAc:undecaprenyl-phosphate GlcNAc-1-phosphate transferase
MSQTTFAHVSRHDAFMSWWVYLTAFLGSLAMSTVLVQASVRLSHRVGALDHPDGARKVQDLPVPKLGGVAVALTFTAIVVPVVFIAEGRSTGALLLGVLLPAIAMALLGFLDDRRPLNPWLRLATQALIAAWAWYAGTRVVIFTEEWQNLALFVLWVVAIVNAVNMLDNSDGLAGSATAIASLAAAAIALINGQYLVGALAFALAGVAAGFLWSNWYPAKVYLGDSGSYFLGFMLAILVVRLTPANIPLGWNLLVPVLLLALPLTDMVYVVTRRLAAGIHPFTAGRDHSSHSLQRRGLSVPQSVLTLQGYLLVTCGLAVWIVAVV